jgi:dipeptidase E
MRVADSANRKLLLLSNSRDESGRFLQHTGDDLVSHFSGVDTVTFVPYAGVTIGWDAYTHHVREAFIEHGLRVVSVHETADPRAAIQQAQAIAVGGGNTFHLLANIQRNGMQALMRERAMSGVPYLGWSAGSVITAPTMKTTNDMPITEPESFSALGLIGFQINAHFTDAHPPGFQGETRRQRLGEFVAANPELSVVGLPEGTWLRVLGASVELRGQHDAILFRANAPEETMARGSELGALLER